eukprot:15365602-Ditylum_brightwellii.AAC.1
MILNLSSTDRIDPADDFVESFKDFMEHSTMAMAYKHLQDQLWERKVPNQNPIIGNSFSCQKAHYVLRVEGVPGSLTIFVLPRLSNFYSSGKLGCIHMQHKFKSISKGKSTLLTKQKIIIPEKVNGGKHMLNAFSATCAELFCNKAMGILELKKMVDFINENENILKEWQQDDNIFMAQWLYVIDCGWQGFLMKEKEEQIDLSTMYYCRFRDDFNLGTFRT